MQIAKLAIFLVYFSALLVAQGPNGLQLARMAPAANGSNQQIEYLFYQPKGMGKDDRLPLILFLHGAGTRGTNAWALTNTGLTKMLAEGAWLPFIVVAPQCAPPKRYWSDAGDELSALLVEARSRFPVDSERIYLTGLSMGGYGAWSLAPKMADQISAMAPICGGGDPKQAPLMKSIPTWVFHGEADKTVALEDSGVMVEAMLREKANVLFTTYPDLPHNCWDATYLNPGLYRWFLRWKLHGQESNFKLPLSAEEKFKAWEKKYAQAPKPTEVAQHERFAAWRVDFALSASGDSNWFTLSNRPIEFFLNRENPRDEVMVETTRWLLPQGSAWSVRPAQSTAKLQPHGTSTTRFELSFNGNTNSVFPVPQRQVILTAGGVRLKENLFSLAVDLGSVILNARARQCGKPPEVDGQINDPAWKTTPVFQFLTPSGAKPYRHTEARLTYDKQNLYLAFVCEEPLLNTIVVRVTNQDGPVWEDDSVEILLDTRLDRKHYFHLIANANGLLYDARVKDREWDSGARVKTGRTKGAWTLEIAVPWVGLEMETPRPNQRIGLELVRTRAQKPQEMTQWCPTFGGNHTPKRFGILTFE